MHRTRMKQTTYSYMHKIKQPHIHGYACESSQKLSPWIHWDAIATGMSHWPMSAHTQSQLSDGPYTVCECVSKFVYI